MTRRSVILLIGVLLLFLATNSVYSEQYDVIDNYYTDSSFCSPVGWDEVYRPTSPPTPSDSDGTITAWRDRTFWGCASHTAAAVFCQHYDGTTFQTIDCPATFNPDNRLRYPSF